MNMKGVSPVVATVLLIAIAVIAAVGVWYWVGAYTSKPATTGTDLKVIEIATCSVTSANTVVRNLGSTPTVAGTYFTVYATNSTPVAYLNLSTAINSLDSRGFTFTLANGTATNITTAGTYKATAAGYQDAQFNCA